ncbi:glycosyltransferase BC10-like [Triticum urartu]|nr:glycosyltransferase BC10-like [Triticum urartu]
MASSSTAKPMEALPSGSGSILSNVVTVLLLLSLGFVFGMVYNANFQESYLTPFLQPLPSLLRPSPTPVVASGVGPPSPSPTSSSQSPPARMGFVDFLAPSGGGLTHNMTDEELFWRASMVPRVARAPRRIVPKVAFLFLVTGDMPLRPLWEKFFAGHEGLYSIYVHASPAYTGSPPADSVFYGRMIPSQNTSWGNMNLVDAERRLLGTALLDLGNARFALLSETCIPLLSFPAAYAFLIGANASFIDSFPTRARHAPFFLRRNISRAQWRKGSQWFEMDRELAIDVVAEERYMAVFRGDHGIANMLEHYMPTLVTLLGWGVRAANRTLTYTDWPRPGPHPASYDVRDVTPELLGGMRRGNGECGYGAGGAVEFCFMFARKFSGDALGKLLELAPKVMGFG